MVRVIACEIPVPLPAVELASVGIEEPVNWDDPGETLMQGGP